MAGQYYVLSDSSLFRWSRRLAWLASIVTLASFLLLPWWPDDMLGASHFFGSRAETLDWLADHEEPFLEPTVFHHIGIGYVRFGCFIHLAAAIVAPTLVARRGWHWLCALLPVTALWQFSYVRSFELINTTGVPYVGVLCGAVFTGCWIAIRQAIATMAEERASG